MKTIFVHHRSPHHAKNSGYGRLINYYSNSIEISGTPKISYKIARLIAALNSQKAGLYNTQSIYKELELFKQLRASKKQLKVVHFLNAERDIRHVVNFYKNSKNIAFCGTFHKPPNILDWRISNPQYVKHLKGAIAVGENQVEYIKNKFGIKKVKFIPHGVDTQFFLPDNSIRKRNRILFVGQHLRDFKAFNYSVLRISEQIKNLNVHVVLHASYKKHIDFHKSVKIFSNLNDTELKQQYNEASLLFLPMIDGTACNSILEGLSCGLPIITTNVGSNVAYLKETESILAPLNNYDYLVENVVSLLNDETKIKYLSKLSRKRALQLDWTNIIKEIKMFHESLFE